MAETSMQICRLCLQLSPLCINLGVPEYYQMLEGLRIKNIPVSNRNVGCTKCILNLKLAYKIQQQMMEAYRTLNLNEEYRKEKLNWSVNLLKTMDVCTVDITVEVPEEESRENKPVSPLRTQTSWTPSVIDDEFCIICGTNVPDDEINVHTKEHFKDFTCCDTDFPHLSEYKEHYQTMHKEFQFYVWKCTFCSMKFRYQFLSEVHTKKAHQFEAEDGNSFSGPTNCEGKIDWPHALECERCGKEFTDSLKYKFHSHEQVDCGLCDAKIYLNEFKEHWKKHQKKIPKICEICGMSGVGKGWMSYHKKTVHSRSEFKCEECGKLFAVRSGLMGHIARIHKCEAHTQCEICGSTFYNSGGLKKHIKGKHLNLRPFHCSICEKSFCNIYTLRTHQRQHSNERPYKCEECGEGFKHNVSLKGHKKSKHGIEEEKKFSCNKCDKKFGTQPALNGHKRKKH